MKTRSEHGLVMKTFDYLVDQIRGQGFDESLNSQNEDQTVLDEEDEE